ncbi:F-box/FBD/LRR-repeat protein-like protein [Tanacetum coccineum]
MLEFSLHVGKLNLVSEFDQIILHLSRINHVKKLVFEILNNHCKLPSLFFTLQGLEYLDITNCVFKPPLTFKGFNRLSNVYFINVEMSAKSLLRFLSSCPLLEVLLLLLKKKKTSKEEMSSHLWSYATKAYNFTSPPQISLLGCLLLYGTMCVFFYSMYDRSSSNSELIVFTMYDDEKLHDRQTSMNLLDLQNDSNLSLDHLEVFKIQGFRNSPFEIEFVKLILAKSPVLKKLTIELSCNVFVDEVRMLRDLIQAPLPRASPSAKFIVTRQ